MLGQHEADLDVSLTEADLLALAQQNGPSL